MRLIVLVVAGSLITLCAGFTSALVGDKDDIIRNKNAKEDNLIYKLKLGWFTLGSGKVSITYDAATVNNKKHHEVYAYTETLGFGSWLANLDDSYTALIDSKTAKTHFAYKHVAYHKSTWEQWDSFNYDSMRVQVKVKDYRKNPPDLAWSVELTPESYDVLGTFLFFKDLDWESRQLRDSVMIKTFYKNKHYRIGMQYMGHEEIEYNDQMVDCYRLHMLLPDHKEFDKKRPVAIWMTRDKKRIPVMVETKLPFIGSARVELIEINDEEPVFDHL